MTDRNETGNDFAHGASGQPQIGQSVPYGDDAAHTTA